MKKKHTPEHLKGRILARVLADDMTKLAVGGKSVSCGWGCDSITSDTGKLSEDQY